MLIPESKMITSFRSHGKSVFLHKLMGYILILSIFPSMTLISCQSSSERIPTVTVEPKATSTHTPSVPTDTQVSINLATITDTPEPLNSPTPSQIPATPDFSNPPIPQKIDAWRPPVYPVPWIPSPQDHFYFVNPIAAYDIDQAYSTYSYGDVFFDNVVHTGIDIPGDVGIPIRAAGDGKVIYSGQGVYRGGNNVIDDPYGKAIVIEHSFTYQGEPLFTLYAHLDEILVSEGETVKSGQRIGSMGTTGKTTGPHLHFEVRVGKNEYFSTRNPDLWLSPPIGWGVLVAQILTYDGLLHEQQVVYLYRAEDDLIGDEIDDILWIGKSYQNEAINSDPYYRENLTISNIPAGTYLVSIPVTKIGYAYQKKVEIKPGQVTFVKFHVWRGFTEDLPPPTPTVIFSPAP
jgi:murein DD-endopeptidase MepM/ murein hydrolase activator NlpD